MSRKWLEVKLEVFSTEKIPVVLGYVAI